MRRATIEVGHKAYGMDFYSEVVKVGIEQAPVGIVHEYAVYLINSQGTLHLVDKIWADQRVLVAVEDLIQAKLEKLVFSGGISDFITRIPIPRKITKYSVPPPK